MKQVKIQHGFYNLTVSLINKPVIPDSDMVGMVDISDQKLNICMKLTKDDIDKLLALLMTKV